MNGQRIMERRRFSDAGQSAKAEETHHHADDVIRRLAKSSSRNDGELSDQPIKRPCLDEVERARTQAIKMGRNKMEKYQQQAKLYQNKDRDTFENFKKNFESTISIESANRAAYIISRKADYGMFMNEIDVINGKFTGEINEHQRFRKNSNELNLSEIAFNQIRLAREHLNKEMPEFNLKIWYAVCITNEETKETVKLFFPEESGPGGKIKADRKTFKAGEDGFIALAGTPTGQSKFYMLAQHPKAFPGKEVTSITVIRHSGGRIDIEYEFGSQLEQKEEADPNTSNTVVFGSRDSLE